MKNNRLVLIHSDEYANWVFDPNHPTQGRRFNLAKERLLDLAPESGVEVVEIESNYLPTLVQLRTVHDNSYIEETLVDGRCGEWTGQRRDLSTIALRMAGGTILAAQELLKGTALTAVNFAGAKHHAQSNRSSGFCVFNDFALAAKHVIADASNQVKRIAILDIDAHHGDGTEVLLKDNPNIFTFSVHDGSIFPGTGHHEDPQNHVFNRTLDAGSGDIELEASIVDFALFSDRFDPDMIFIAIGADGHESDPLSSLNYTIDGMVNAVRLIRRSFPTTPILLGGAGGYQPDMTTPDVWARMALAAALEVNDSDRFFVDCYEEIGYFDDPEERSAFRIGAHTQRSASLFVDPDETPLPPKYTKVEWVAPEDPENEHLWVPARIGQIRAGEKVRVLRDAFPSATVGKRHNGRICEVVEVRDGNVICKSLDDREPILTETRYAPYDLEQWSGTE
jgi:acetoin utilization protein AcuC